MTAENSFLNTDAVNNAEVSAMALISCVAQWAEKDVVDLKAEQGIVKWTRILNDWN